MSVSNGLVWPLTRRELQCVQLTCQGFGQKQIATELGISKRTVEVHLSSARYKLGAESTPQMTYLAAVHGIVVEHDGLNLKSTNVSSFVFDDIVVGGAA